jgi:hypothetical protein
VLASTNSGTEAKTENEKIGNENTVDALNGVKPDDDRGD